MNVNFDKTDRLISLIEDSLNRLCPAHYHGVTRKLKKGSTHGQNFYKELVEITESNRTESEKQNERILAFARYYDREGDMDYGQEMLKRLFDKEDTFRKLTKARWQIYPYQFSNWRIPTSDKEELTAYMSRYYDKDSYVDVIVDAILKEPRLSDIEREFWANCPDASTADFFRNLYRERWRDHLHRVEIDETGREIADEDLCETLSDLRLCGLLSEDEDLTVRWDLCDIAESVNALTEGIIALFGSPECQTVATNAINPVTSKIHLSKEKGVKIDYIRVINCLYELGFFKDDKGNDVTKKDVFAVFGAAVNKDLSDYDKDLSRSLSDSTALEKHLKIFDLMKEKMTGIFNAK
ncbi:MAG: hypothetical protein LBG15_03515 [Dysgonamonadaceae bacterium]|jgi:hypothetical protein|nr:hypothetical protein [Dysgonamonadaceae bacterium]